MLNQYLIEANSGQYDYVKALAEFKSKDESALNFKKGEIIAVVPKHDAYTQKVNKQMTRIFVRLSESNLINRFGSGMVIRRQRRPLRFIPFGFRRTVVPANAPSRDEDHCQDHQERIAKVG